MSASKLIEPIQPNLGDIHLPEATGWMQGRTLYGGASSLIAYTAAIRAFPGLPPLRAAQVGFIGPVGEHMQLKAHIVRQGKSVTQIASEIYSPEGAMLLSASFIFGASREENAAHAAPTLPDFPKVPDEEDDVFRANSPAFLANNYEVRRAPKYAEKGEPVVRRWIRLKEPSGLDTVSELILMGDTLPPGSMKVMKRMGPISSINWAFNVLNADCNREGGWWLSETRSEWAAEGYSSEQLRMWDSTGTMALSGMQSVAVFG